MSYLSREQFEKHLAHMRRAENLIIDTEGTLTHPHSETWGLSYSSFGLNEYFGFNHKIGENLPKEWLPELRQVVEDAPCITMHNAKHDLRALRNLGIDRFNKKFYCTMVMSHMTDENRFTTELGPLSVSMGGQPKAISKPMQLIIDGFADEDYDTGHHMVPVEMWIDYASNDAYITEDPVFSTIYPDFVDQGYDGELWDWEQRWTFALCAIEDAGVLIDVDLAEQEYHRGRKIMAEMQKELGFNPGSSVQLGNFLVDKLGLPVLKWTTGGQSGKRKPSFTKDVMERYDTLLEQRGDKRAKQILRYRGWQKCTSSSYLPYIERRSPVDGRLRTNYRMDRARTGRLTASVLHQIPRVGKKEWNENTKKCIITEKGRTAWEFDYSQLEFRTGALYAVAMDPSGKTQRLLDIFNTPGRDIFTEMAAHNGIERDPMKTTAYLIQFGGGAKKLSESLNISELSARGTISEYFRNYPGFATAARFAEQRANQNGYVSYWTGRRRHFKFSLEHHKAFNSLCQGGAFEIVKRQGTRIHEAGLNNDECRMDLTVHDSFRFSIENGKEDKYLPEIKAIMEDVASLAPDKLSGVRFAVDINKWATKEKWIPK
jgi:DNA polymerase I-like protein with 3'-5' exonuclease and polymerase domains